MKQLDYVPNELAKSIFRQYTKTVGIIVPFISHPYFGKLVESLELYATKNNYRIFLCNSYYEKDKEKVYLRMLESNRVDGLILASRNLDISYKRPTITIDRILSDHIPCVSSDNYRGGILATQHLIDRNCKKIAFIGGSPDLHLTANLRSNAFVDTCINNGIEPIVVTTDENEFSTMTYYSEIRKLFQSHPDIDGVFASSDVIAAQVIQVAREFAFKIPEDLKVVGYDDTYISQLTSPQLTTIQQPIEQMSKYTFQLLMNEINHEIVPMRTVLPVKLIVRKST